MTWMVLVLTDPGDVDVPTSWWDALSGGEIIIGLLAVALLLLAIVKFVKGARAVRKVVKPLEDFFRDWNGEDARPGVDARPGIMSRMAAIESHLNDAPTRSEFASLERQVVRNTARLDLVMPRSMRVTETEEPTE